MSAFDLGGYLLAGAVGLLVLIVVGLCLYGLVYLAFGRHVYAEARTVTAKVLATSFHPERTHTGVGVGMVGGQMGTMITSETEDEEDIVLLKSSETGRIQIDNADLLDAVTQGEEVRLTYRDKYFYWAWNPYSKEMVEHEPIKVVTQKGETVRM